MLRENSGDFETKTSAKTALDDISIESEVNALASNDGLERWRARKALVAAGRRAVPFLIRALSHRDAHVRWEAAKGLREIWDPSAAPALVEALNDENSGVRWLAASALAELGCAGLPPLLNALIEHSDSSWLRAAAHHVFFVLSGTELHDLVMPVLHATEDVEPVLQLPLAATAALGKLTELYPNAVTIEEACPGLAA